MSTTQQGPQSTHYQERFMRGAYFKASTSFVFPENGPDSRRRYLELHLAQPEIHEDSDPLDILLAPLTVLMIEEVDETGQGKTSIYEDVYYFTHDGDFFRHKWRKGYRDTQTRARTYPQERYEQDGDMKKLCLYGEPIRDTLKLRRMDHNLEEHPTVQGLKNHTLWQHMPDPCH